MYQHPTHPPVGSACNSGHNIWPSHIININLSEITKLFVLLIFSTAITCNKYVDEIQEASYSSYDMMTRKTCGCYCHDGFLDHIACPYCEWQHMLTQYSGDNGSHGRLVYIMTLVIVFKVTVANGR